jgi:signal transduction histidine kinase
MDEWLGSVFDTMSEGFSIQQIIYDPQGQFYDLRYVAVNPAFERQTGLIAADILGKTKRELQLGGADTWFEPYQKAAATGEAVAFEIAFGPQKRTFQVSAYRIDPHHLAVIFFDVDDRKQAERAVEAASKAKDQFIAVLSHELRTPLTPALAAIQMLESETNLAAEHRDVLRMIRRNVQLEARLIDDLLDVTRITRNKLELQLASIDLHEKIRHVLKICAAEIAEKQLVLETALDAHATQVTGDPTRLQQIIWNLVKNAIKFSSDGGTITVKTCNQDEQITLSVADTGIGIEPEALAHIFEAFEQGSRQVTQRFGGLGLGLTISKALVEMHKGSITASSSGSGKGACFSINLPVKSAGPATAIHTQRPPPPALSCSALLVEDHNDTRQIMTRLLKRLGCAVQSAANGVEALNAAKIDRFDLLICDIGLPDMSGLEVMRQLKSQYGLRGIALSGYGMDEDIERSKHAGFEVHLTKPINLQILEETVRRLTTRL